MSIAAAISGVSACPVSRALTGLGINRVKVQPITPKGRRHLSIKLRIIIVIGI